VRDPLDLIRIALVVTAVVLLVRRGLDAGTLTMTLARAPPSPCAGCCCRGCTTSCCSSR
jgi:hypothetical protein